MTNPVNTWAETEHVLAGPFAEILARACAEEYGAAVAGWRQTSHFDHDKSRTRPATSRSLLTRRYAERFGTSERTAERHFSLVLSQATIPVVIADRVAALCGVPYALIEATRLTPLVFVEATA